MIFFYWFLVIGLAFWYLGALSFVYHIFAFRYPRDISLPMLLVFLVFAIPVSLVAIGYIAELFGGLV